MRRPGDGGRVPVGRFDQRRVGQSGPLPGGWNRQARQRRGKGQQRCEAAAAHRETVTTGNPAASGHGWRRRGLDAASGGWWPCSGGPALRNAPFRLGGDGDFGRGAGDRADGPLSPTLRMGRFDQRRVGQSGPLPGGWNRQARQRRGKSQQRCEAAAAHRETVTTGNPAASGHGWRRRGLDAASGGWWPCSGGPALRNAAFRLGGGGDFGRGAGDRADGPL